MKFKNVKFYAVINRGKGFVIGEEGTNGTRIRLKSYKHPETLKYLENVYESVKSLIEDNPDKTPMRIVTANQFDIFKHELKLKIGVAEGMDGDESTTLETFQIFTTGKDPFLSIASENMTTEIQDVSKTAQKAQEDAYEKLMREPISNVFSVKTTNILRKVFEEKFGYYDQQVRDINFYDIMKISENDILAVKGSGMATLNEVKSYLIFKGIIVDEDE